MSVNQDETGVKSGENKSGIRLEQELEQVGTNRGGKGR